jgi:uncharacterized protein YfbU (UPF0304 family)
MATMTIRLDDRTREDLDAVAGVRGVTVSDLLRAAIDVVLGRDLDRVVGDAPLSLSPVQRRMLTMQHQILSRLNADEADHHHKMVEVLERGFTGEYASVFESIRPELSHQECALVWDLLEMFRQLRFSLGRLDTAERAALGDERTLIFRGFDFNDSREARLASYARYLVVTNGQWEELGECFDDEHERGNSHMPVLAAYQRMLDAFTPIWENKIHAASRGGRDYALSAKQLVAVAAAAWPPALTANR